MKKWENVSDWFLEKRDSDFQIHAETEKSDKEVVFPGHGFVLNKVSLVFQVMLETGSFVESQTKVIKLKIYGDETHALAFVRWLYTKELKPCDENSYVSLMRTAHMYEVKQLVEECEKRLLNDLKLMTICQLYCTLRNIASRQFLNRCRRFMAANATVIFKNDLHIPLEEEALAYLLSSPGKTFVEMMASSAGPRKINAPSKVYFVRSGIITEESKPVSGPVRIHAEPMVYEELIEQKTAQDEEFILDALWYWLQARCLFEGKNEEEESRRVMPNLIKKRSWNNLNSFSKDKPWYNLVKEFGEVPKAQI